MLESITGTSSVQIASSVESAVRAGSFRGGETLPTVRALAERLGVSPTTVSAAYRELARRGVVRGMGRRGTVVNDVVPVAAAPIAVPAQLPEGVRNLYDGNPDPELLPRLDRAIASLDGAPRLYGGELKSDRLLAAASTRLSADGIAADHVAVVSGALDGIERVLHAHLRPGDRVAVEDPGFIGVFDLLAALSLVAVPVAVDDEGMLPDALDRALASGVSAVIVTPRAHNPCGSALSAQRARDVARCLDRYADVLVIEDDHAAEVCGAPLEALAPTVARRDGRWAYTRSAAKALGPDLRLAVMAGDADTIARVEGRQLAGVRWVSHLLQEIVATLWSDGAVAKRLAKAERVYAERRSAALDALESHGIRGHGRTGLNVWIPVRDEAAVADALLAKGWAVAPGARFRIGAEPGVRATVARLAPKDARAFARDLAAALADPPRRANV